MRYYVRGAALPECAELVQPSPAGLFWTCRQIRDQFLENIMSRLPSNRTGQSFIEYALIIILLAIVMLSILLILGDDLRTFINDLMQTWFPTQLG
jgi:Flp pilus assembly pilin Flp